MMQLRIFYNGCKAATAKICPNPAPAPPLASAAEAAAVVADGGACKAVGGKVAFSNTSNFTAVMTVPCVKIRPCPHPTAVRARNDAGVCGVVAAVRLC